jgi:hypothetical protein
VDHVQITMAEDISVGSRASTDSIGAAGRDPGTPPDAAFG